MRQISILILTMWLCAAAKAQWVNMVYPITDSLNKTYGTVVDFAGNTRDLLLDYSVPVGDVVPACGRPLILVIHGGGFMGGSKNESLPVQMRQDFAKRGYVAAAINYRLGMFQPSLDHHCNISYFGFPWDCANQADKNEWLRAWYRGIQDARGAIRWLLNQPNLQVDPRNVFVAGESAGAIIAMGVGYMDVASEKPAAAGALASVPAPNIRYESLCVQYYGWDANIASMALARPDLGSIDGALNPSAPAYTVKGVGCLYGGMFGNLFATHANNAAIPTLYLFHQTNDLIVPYGRKNILSGINWCLQSEIPVCTWMINLPTINGGSSIRSMIDSMALLGQPVPTYGADLVTNNNSCTAQIFNGNVAGHRLDNTALRLANMATRFAARVNTAPPCGASKAEGQPTGLLAQEIQVYPNPTTGTVHVQTIQGREILRVRVMDLRGQLVFEAPGSDTETSLRIQFPSATAAGTYLLSVETPAGTVTKRVVLQ